MKIVLSDILKGKKRIALSGHVRPDGDCVGSSMGLYLYLTEQFPEIEVDQMCIRDRCYTVYSYIINPAEE